MNGVLMYLDALANEQKLFRRALLVWAMTLFTWVVLKVFGTPFAEISTHVVAAMGIVNSMLVAVIGLYQWLRARDEERDRQEQARTNREEFIP